MAMDLSGHGGEIPIPIPIPTHNEKEEEEEEEEEDEEEERSKKQIVLLPSNNAGINNSSTKVVRYRECLKNHAASMGGTATDGCGEFMPSGQEGSLEAFKCSACSCHRNFHRKEVEGEPSPFFQHHQQLQELYHYNNQQQAAATRYLPSTPARLIMPLGAVESEDHEVDDGSRFGMMMMMRGPHHLNYSNYSASDACVVKKRFRTKFTQEQKEKMLGFAERVGWKLQRQEEGSVQQLCQEIGVKRRVLKVWMHNNKHSLASKKSNSNSSSSLAHCPFADD